jgi:hypothetical protein
MKYLKLTPEQKAAYLADSGRCPYCGEEGVEGAEVECEGDKHYQNINCNACGRDWVDVYTLSEIEEGENACDVCGEIIKEGEEVEANDYAGFTHAECLPAYEDQDSDEGFLEG